MKRDTDPESGRMWAGPNKTERSRMLIVAADFNEAAFIEQGDPLGDLAKNVENGIREWLEQHRGPDPKPAAGAKHKGQREDPLVGAG